MGQNYYSSLNRPAKATLWYVASGVITKAAGLLCTPIFTRLLSEEEYGAFALYMSWLGLLSLAFSSFISSNVIYRGLGKFENDSERFISSVLGTGLSFVIAFCLLLFAFNGFLKLPIEWILFIILQLCADCAIGIALMKRRYEYSFLKVVSVGVFTSLAAPLLSLILLRFTNLGYKSRIYGLLLVSMVCAIPLVIDTLHHSTSLFDKRMWKYNLKSSLPLLPSAVSSAINGQLDKLIIPYFIGTAALAKYSVAHSIGVGLLFIVSSLSSSLNPWIMRRLATQDTERIGEVVSVLISFFGAAVLFITAIAPEAFAFLAPASYSDAIIAIFPITLSTLPTFMTAILQVGFIFRERAWYASVSAISGAGINVAANFILIPRLSYLGAGVSLLLATAVSTAISIYFAEKLSLSEIIPKRKAAFSILFTLIWGTAISLSYAILWLRIILLIPVAIMLLNSSFLAKKYVFE